MHRCLQIPDILQSIFESLAEPLTEDCHCEGLPDGFVTLAWLARTCKVFQMPAIRALWREIPGLYVIAHLFPRKSLKIDRAERYCAASSLNFEAFSARLSVYKRYVESIRGTAPKCEGHTAKSLHSSLLFLLLESTDVPAPLFPNAHHVTIPCLTDFPMESLLYPPLVIGPSVRSVLLDTDDAMVEKADPRADRHPRGDARQWDVINAALLRTAPRLSSFSVHISEPESVTVLLERPQIDLLVQRLSTGVTNIDISTVLVSTATLRAVSSLSMLSSLGIVIGRKDRRLAGSQHSLTLQFPALHTLRVVLPNEFDRPDVFAGLCAPLLRKCTIAFHFMLEDKNGQLPLDDVLDYFFKRDRRLLTQFIISNVTCNRVDWAMVPFEVTARTLRHLAKGTNLTKIIIDYVALSLRDKVTDDDLAHAFSCWNKLESFSMYLRKNKPGSLALTAQGVHNAIKACPKLRHLMLPCDFRTLSSTTSEVARPHHSLETWNVCSSPIDSAIDVGLWLRSRFPNLEELAFENHSRGLMLDFDSHNIWLSYKEEAITLTQWVQVPKLLEGAESDMEVDE
ncbi:hypothetical protein BKA70DRAFT_1293312 [Coprinopsis sp. MPI-PUGE-AT-0042]|nr:hypothetical protein BKA70DRAFT_1293312 [Coprinopsis sp. MPI-PUGE-AT-0042]